MSAAINALVAARDTARTTLNRDRTALQGARNEVTKREVEVEAQEAVVAELDAAILALQPVEEAPVIVPAPTKPSTPATEEGDDAEDAPSA